MQKYFCFSQSKSALHHLHPGPIRGASAIVTTRGGLRWTRRCRRRAALTRTAKTCGPDAAVLASSCAVSPASDGGKRAVHRGDHVISRKAIAQGMSDVLRCPVCSCAHSLCTLRMRPRVQRASGIPCALWIERAGRISFKTRAQSVARIQMLTRHPEV